MVVLLVAVAAIAVSCERTDGTVTGVVLAGPTCPVVQEPPDPACDDRPVAGAEIVVIDANGDEVARAQTDDAGAFQVALPAGTTSLCRSRWRGCSARRRHSPSWSGTAKIPGR